VLLETFIFLKTRWDELQQVLIESRPVAGSEVQVMVERLRPLQTLSNPFVAAMSSVGVNVHVFDPQPRSSALPHQPVRRLQSQDRRWWNGEQAS